MLKRMLRLIEVIQRPYLAKTLLMSSSIGGYLSEIGWVKSFLVKMPVDKHGNPYPWVTYPFIDFIGVRLNKSMNVFEYGSGNSTFYYADKVKSVISVEHDRLWYEQVKNKISDNVTLIYQDLDTGNYSMTVGMQQKLFDIIIVDGRDRINCLKQSINALSEEGIIVLDDSEREIYVEGIVFLKDNGFNKIDFWGISPGLLYKKCTSIFYKQGNCLTI
jgi:hypothetical protein